MYGLLARRNASHLRAGKGTCSCAPFSTSCALPCAPFLFALIRPILPLDQAQQYRDHRSLASAAGGDTANAGPAPSQATPVMVAPAPQQRCPTHIAIIPAFPIPELWARPDWLPLTPPPLEEENVETSEKLLEDAPNGEQEQGAKDDGTKLARAEKNLTAADGGSDGVKDGKDDGDTVEVIEGDPDRGDAMEVVEGASADDKQEGEKGGGPQAELSMSQTTTTTAAGEHDGDDDDDDDPVSQSEAPKSPEPSPPVPSTTAHPTRCETDENRKTNGKGKAAVGSMEEEVEEGEKEEHTEQPPEPSTIAARRKAEKEKILADKRAEEATAKAAETAAAEQAEAVAKAEAEVAAKATLEAARKAAEESREAEHATLAVETAARRLRVNLILRRLRENAEERQRRRRPFPPADPRYYSGANAIEAAAAEDEEVVVAVPRLKDRAGRDSGRHHQQTQAVRQGEDRFHAGGQTGKGRSESIGASGAAEIPSSGVAEAAADGCEGYCWPPLGKRRLKRRLDRVRRLASLSQGRGPHQRLRILQEAELIVRCAGAKIGSGKASVGGGTGGWLEAKLGRMRKCEEAEWNAWKSRVEGEERSTPGEVAGPPLPYGFVPRLAHRALGAYALIRTFSRPFRLTPCSSVAFLRAMTVKLRNPLLDAVHCELLRRISCLLKGRIGGWSKGRDAQRELDWRYLDQVRLFRGSRLRFFGWRAFCECHCGISSIPLTKREPLVSFLYY